MADTDRPWLIGDVVTHPGGVMDGVSAWIVRSRCRWSGAMCMECGEPGIHQTLGVVDCEVTEVKYRCTAHQRTADELDPGHYEVGEYWVLGGGDD